jgi:hypothetical protein
MLSSSSSCTTSGSSSASSRASCVPAIIVTTSSSNDSIEKCSSLSSPLSITSTVTFSPSSSPHFRPKLKNELTKIPSIFWKASSNETENQDCVSSVKAVRPKSSNLRKKKKHVTFNSTISVVLIPSREEYHEEGLSSVIWYNANEIRRMEKKALVCLSFGRFYKEKI